MTGGIVLFALFLPLVLLLAWYGYRHAEQRKKDLREWAQRRGLSFTPDKDATVDSRYSQFSCFQAGNDRYAYNIIQGMVEGREIHAFDYHYETESTDSKGNRETSHHYFSALIVDAGLPLKPLFIRGENFFDKITEFLGFDDIDFEYGEFNRKFHVTSPDRRWAFDVLHQEAMEFLLQSPRFRLQFTNRRVLVLQNGMFSPTDYDNGLKVSMGLLDRLPDSVIRELKGVG